MVEWHNVFEVVYTEPSLQKSEEIVCSICLENLREMVAPRVTKCGHMFCYSCLLQYY